MDYLTWTYFFRRLTKNPAYYGLMKTTAEDISTFLKNLVTDSLRNLVKAGCIVYNSEDETVTPTRIGTLASFYYLTHETMHYMN